jgi:hypothetical protein
MKTKDGILSGIPVNAVVILAMSVFVVQVFLVLFYNNFNLTLANIESFYSLDKAVQFADSGLKVFSGAQSVKETDGILYPAVMALIYKLLGKNLVLPVIYVLSFLAFSLCTAVFYKLAAEFFGAAYAMIMSVVFVTIPPVILGLYSGGDVLGVFTLFSLNLYYLKFSVEKKRFTGAFVTGALLLLTNLTGAMFGVCAIAYALIKKSEKKAKQNYGPVLWGVLGTCAAIFSVVLAYVFIDKFSIDWLQERGMFNSRTFFVDTFLKDGFIWSKAVCPVMAALFFVYLFIKLAEDAKSRAITINYYFLLVSLAAVLMGFFSSFPDGRLTHLFVSPFFLVMALCACGGALEVSGMFQDKKGGIFSRQNLLYGMMVFMIVYNGMLYFGKAIENDNRIKFIANEKIVENFTER